MKREWDIEELVEQFSLVGREVALLDGKASHTQLGLAVQLKFFQSEGRFPSNKREIPRTVLAFIAQQIKVDEGEFGKYAWDGRTIKRDRNVIRLLARSLRETEDARARAERSDQVKSAFLASMSHELRTPLNGIINFTEYILDGDTGEINEEQKSLLSEVSSGGKHLLALINDVLDMSKIEAGSLTLFVEDNIDLAKLLDNAVTTCRRMANANVPLTTAFDENLPPIRADRQRVLQIMLNILSNACKFTQEGEIKLSAHQDKSEILISVMDTGPGIKVEDQQLVFEAFKQTQTGLRQRGGTGLGMPISKSLVEAHGGRLWLESTPGKGTTFYVALPVKSDQLKPYDISLANS